jgi:hypothetical protein
MPNPVKQWFAYFLFQRLYMVRKGGLSNVQPLGGLSKMKDLRKRHEVMKSSLVHGMHDKAVVSIQ